MKQSKLITAQEIQELWNAGLVIHGHYVGIVEGIEYNVYPISNWETTIAIRMSQRAAYNAAKKYLSAQQSVQQIGGTPCSYCGLINWHTVGCPRK